MKPWENGVLCVSKNKRYLCNGDQPFFWLGDTAWLMFSRLNEEEAFIYLKNRKEKGYNVIQITLIHKWPQKNLEGQSALIDEDFAKPDENSGYWNRVFRMVKMAEDLGLYVALLPTWGGNVARGHLNLDNAKSYLGFLIQHFGNSPNIIWLVGGDVKGSDAKDVFCYMGKTLKEACKNHLVAFHPFGRTSSSDWFHEESWLDFNMFQSGHRRYDQVMLGAWDDNGKNARQYGEDSFLYVEADYLKEPKKPVIDGEPSYEQVLQGLHDETQPYWQSWDTRRYAYWSVFAGAFGHTFGDNSIMQFHRGEDGEKGAFGAWQHWKEALHNVGAMQMSHLKALMESVSYQKGKCAQELVVAGQGEQYEQIRVFAGEDFVFCYDYSGIPFSLDLSSYKDWFDGYWMDPTTGIMSYFGKIENQKKVDFIPVKRLEGHGDWVLVLR